MSFTKKPICVDLGARGCAETIIEKKVVTEKKDGRVRNKVVVQKTPIKDLVEEMKVFNPEDYTLENLLKAGVPLDRVNCSNLIHTNDKAEIEEQLSTLAGDAWEKLQYIDWQKTQENNEVKTVNDEN